MIALECTKHNGVLPRRLSAVLAASLSLAACGGVKPYRVAVPLGLDLFAPIPEENPLTAARVALGRRLFFDPRLSADLTVRCASCHRPDHAFADTVARSSGAYGRIGRRNAPTVLNIAYGRAFFWDGRVSSLEEQVLQPIENPEEMGLQLGQLLGRLRADRSYTRAFRGAFGNVREAITRQTVARALASYLRTLRSGDSPADRFLAGDASALSSEARAGLILFTGKARCSTCHSGATFSDGEFHDTGVGWGSSDVGRAGITGDERDRGLFRTPTLREVARTAPYMHDGSLRTLEEVVAFYDRGARANPNLDQQVQPLGLSDAERLALVEFLRALSGSPR